MYKCRVPEHGEMEAIRRFTGTHITGDEKYYEVRYCRQCNTYHLFVSMEATVSYGVNYFTFRIDLTDDEAREMLAVMSDDSDASKIEEYLDAFDQNNRARRVIIEDEREYWTARE
ncbi:MAG TPA: hypothetical protein GX008_09955 [Firmicutes bacterium]|jgi:hypothetical protein|nr:hypothetical protein [Bacillota bacterium]